MPADLQEQQTRINREITAQVRPARPLVGDHAAWIGMAVGALIFAAGAAFMRFFVEVIGAVLYRPVSRRNKPPVDPTAHSLSAMCRPDGTPANHARRGFACAPSGGGLSARDLPASLDPATLVTPAGGCAPAARSRPTWTG